MRRSIKQKTEGGKECRDCRHFNTMPDWTTVDYRILDEDLSISNKTVGDNNPVLKRFSEHDAGFGKVYTVCGMHKVVLACNRANICNDFERKD